jgi:hypothetical protein
MRHAIKGLRPGQTIHTAGGFVATNAIDGGARFSDRQIKDLTTRGYELIKLPDAAPEAVETVDADAQARIAEQAAAAAELATKATAAPKKVAK